MILIAFCGIILLNYCVLMLTFSIVWYKKTKREGNAVLSNNTFVSVIVSFKNEEANIESCIQSLIAQEYPKDKFELILVNDHSTDNGLVIVQGFVEKYPFIKIISSEVGEHGKKSAIEKAVKIAKGKLIVTTDADCVVGLNWVRSIVLYYELTKSKLIISPVLIKGDDSFFQKLQAIEYSGLMLVSASAMYMKMPLMCSGANLAYEKDAFVAVGGYSGIRNLQTGDDVMLLMKIAENYPGEINFLSSKDAWVNTKAVKKIKHFVNQRKRWSSKAFIANSFWAKYVASSVYFTNLVFLILLIMTFKQGIILAIIFWALKGLADLLILVKGAHYFEIKLNPVALLIIEPLYAFYVVYTGFFALFPSVKWK